MLSQDDRRELAAIEHQLEASDPRFAQALRAGRPHQPSGNRRWPLYLAMLVTSVVFLTGLTTQTIWLMIAGAVTWCAATATYQLKVRRSQKPRIRRRGRYSP